jgi:TRAP-type C4-dicarboxylate transport system substrate-binding protein
VPSPPYAVISNDPITDLDGFAGKKIRVLGNVMPKLVEAAGGVPLSVAFSEIYTSLQTGVINGALTDPPAMLNAKLFEVAKNLVTTGPGNGALTAIAPVAYFVNLKDWNALPKDIQEAVLSVAKEMTTVGSEKMTELADASIGKLRDDGVEVHHLSAEDTEKLAQKAPDFLTLAASVLTKNGLPGDKIISEYRRLADAYIAGK